MRWVVEVLVPPTTDEEEGRIWDVLHGEGIHVDSAFQTGTCTIFSGEMTMEPGEPPRIAHERIRKAVGEIPMRSKWLLLDELPWDHELGDEIE